MRSGNSPLRPALLAIAAAAALARADQIEFSTYWFGDNGNTTVATTSSPWPRPCGIGPWS